MKYLIIALMLALTACTSIQSYGIEVGSSVEDPRAVAEALAEHIAWWDENVGNRPFYPIHALGHGAMPWSNSKTLGRCEHYGSLEIWLDLDNIRAASSDPSIVFRHVLFHEMTHAQLTCSDADHSSDPYDLMYPTTNRLNLEALPSPAEIAKMR